MKSSTLPYKAVKIWLSKRKKNVKCVLLTRDTSQQNNRLKIKECSNINQANANTKKAGVATLL